MPNDKQDDTQDTDIKDTKDVDKDPGSKSKTDKDDADETVSMKTSELESLLDKRVTQALETQQKKHEKKQAKQDDDLEQQRLESEGKYKELADKRAEELEVLKAERADRQFRDDARTKLKDLELESLAEVLLQPIGSDLDKLELNAQKLRKLLDAEVEAAVNERLSTGSKKRVVKGKVNNGAGSVKDMSDDERLAFIEEHGSDAYQAKLDAAYASPG